MKRLCGRWMARNEVEGRSGRRRNPHLPMSQAFGTGAIQRAPPGCRYGSGTFHRPQRCRCVGSPWSGRSSIGYRHTLCSGTPRALQRRRADVVQPGHPALADMSCFRHEHRSLVAARQLVEHVHQIAALRVFQMPVQPVVRWAFLLVAVVVVDGRYVEVAARTAQAGLQVAMQHV